MNLTNKIRLILSGFLTAILLFLLVKAVAPGGKAYYEKLGNQANFFIGKLTPEERLAFSEGKDEIEGNPVYFSLRTMRKFDKARLILKFKNKNAGSANPIIEAGVLDDRKIWRYDLKPVENKIINDLLPKWNIAREGNTVLLQRNSKYQSINEFLEKQPPAKELGVYNYDLKYEYIDKIYAATKASNSIARPLQGAYQFFTYIKNEPLIFNFTLVDANKRNGKDAIEVNLYYEGQAINTEVMSDDGDIIDDGKIFKERNLKLNIPSLPEGAYKIEVKAGDDIVTKKIITSQSKLTFINKIWLADDGGKKMEIFTDSKEASFQTTNPGRLQKINVDGNILDINQTYKQFSVKTKEKISRLAIEKDDIMISGNGMFSFSKNEFFNPLVKRVDENMDVDRDGVNYILADYIPPRQEGEWKISETEFDLTKAYRESQKYGFILSVPGLDPEDSLNDGIIIDSIKIELEGKNLWQFIRSKLSRTHE